MTLDSVRVALRGVLANRMRSALTMLGILIGTAAVILLVGVGKGISDKVQDQIKSLGTNAIYVIPERNSRGQDRGGTSSRRVRLNQKRRRGALRSGPGLGAQRRDPGLQHVGHGDLAGDDVLAVELPRRRARLRPDPQRQR